MRLAFVLDGYAVQAGVAVTQPAPDVVRFEVVGDVDPERAAAQAARVLSLDEDATGYDRMVDRDPLLRSAYDARPGLRPPLFHSAYEALVWAVLSARRPVGQMREVPRPAVAGPRPGPRRGRRAGRRAADPGRSCCAVRSFPGIPEVKLRRMHAIAAAALEGRLDTEALRMRDVAEVGGRAAGLRGDRAVLRRAGHASARSATPTYCRRPSRG